MTTEELEDLKEKIEETKSEKAKAEGAIDQIEKQWKDEFDCSSVEEVEKEIDTLDSQITTLDAKLEKYEEEIQEVIQND